MRERSNAAARLAVGAALAALCAGPLLGCDEDVAPPDGSVGDAGAPIDAVDVDTVAPERARAGQPLALSCVLIDAAGEAVAPPPDLEVTYRFVPEGGAVQLEDGSWAATQVGRLEVACVVGSLRLTDATPAIVEIDPGEPAFVVTRLDLDSVEAGEQVDVTCEVYDAFGNRIEDAGPSVRSEPEDDANTFEGLTGRFEAAGSFELYCQVPGAESRPAELEVRPGLPASLVLARVPFQDVYARGQVIDVQRLVADRFGNPVPDARAPTVSRPDGQALGDGRWRYAEDGRYEVTATVEGPTHEGRPLSASTVILVDGDGPAIACDEPLNGAILDRTPGGSITFRGSVSDLSGISEVRINGAPVTVTAGGAFEAPLTTEYGINFVDIAAVDTAGREASRTCAFLVSDTWAPDTRTFADTLSLRLRQGAFDDDDRADGLDSITDVLSTVLNSTGLRDTLHSTLSMSPTLKASGCDQRVLGLCVLSSQVRYQDLDVRGPNSVSLDLVADGLSGVIRVENLRVRIRVDGRVAGIRYDTSGWVTLRHVEVRAIFDTRLSGGRPQIAVRPGSVTTSVGAIDTDFRGLDGAVINIVVDLFNRRVRNLIAGLVRDWVTGSLNGILDGLVSSLDIATLGSAFDVPRLDDATQTLPLTFGVGFSSLSTTPSRMLFGIGTRFFTPAAHARPTLGAPSRAGPRRLDVGGSGTSAVAVHESLLNQALHALWRGGFFDATLDSAAIGGGVPSGIEAELAMQLTPVARVTGEDRVELSLGALSLRLRYPALFTEPVNLQLGVRASMAARLVGEDLVFDDFRIDELFFSTDLASLEMATRQTLEGFLRRFLERVIGPALNDALPAIPIPAFTLPASLSVYGLPAGAELGITSPALSLEEPHVVLRGGFAVR